MTPVSELTIEQAVAELEQIADAKPSEDQVIERARWHKQFGDRIAALEERINQETPEPITTAEQVREIGRTVLAEARRSPSELLVLKVQTYARVHAELVAAPDNKRLRNHLNVIRFAVRDLVQRIGCQMPELPAAPESPFGHKPRKPMPVPPHRPVREKAKAADPAPEPEPEPEPAPEAPIEEAPIVDVVPAPSPAVSPDTVRRLIDQLRITGKAVQGLAVLLSPWGNPAVVEQLQPQGLAAVAELMAIVGLHVEGVADEAERVA